MRNLANIEASIANILARVELLKADVHTFEVMRIAKTDMQCNIIGLRSWKSGQGAIFVREPETWIVRLRQPLDSLSSLGPDVECLKDEDGGDAPRVARLRTQQALEGLVELLGATFGEQSDLKDALLYHGLKASDLCEHFSWFDPEELLFLPIEYERHSKGKEHVLARLEVTGLRSLGRARGTAWDIESCDAEAFLIARHEIGSGSPESLRIAASLAVMMEEQVRRLVERVDEMTLNDPGRCQALQELGWAIQKHRHWYCYSIDPWRQKEVNLPWDGRAEMLQLEIVQLLNARRLQLEQDNTESWGRVLELAFVCARLATIWNRLTYGHHKQSVKQLSDEAAEYKARLPEPYRAKLEEALAQESKMLHQRAQ